jgi:glycosyltransferase involved in cell wall biosynthesis
MPVYNEGRYIGEALDSLLAQDFEDFEIIISDNASQDATRTICLDYARRDKRIKYFRNKNNMGSVINFNRVFRLSSGKYFMWAGGNDVWDRRFISHCLQVLLQDPSVVLCYSRTMAIDPDGNHLGVMPDRLDTRGLDLVTRFQFTLRGLVNGNPIYGIIRSDALKQTRLFVNTLAADFVLLAELSLIGCFAQVPEVLFYRRRPKKFVEYRERVKKWCEGLDPTFRSRYPWLPHWRLSYEYLSAVNHAKLPFRLKARLMAYVIKHCIRAHPSFYHLLDDLRYIILPQLYKSK